MGCDIHSFAEQKINGRWKKVDESLFRDGEPISVRNYGVFGFLADVRNYSFVPHISEVKGLPKDSEYLNEVTDDWAGNKWQRKDDISYDTHNSSYVTLKELIDFNYDETFEDRRGSGKISNNTWSGSIELKKGEGEIISFREFLQGSDLFEAIRILKPLGKPEDIRIVFWFDS